MRRLLAWLGRHWLVVLIVVGFIVLVALRFDDLVTVLRILAAGDWPWITAAVLMQVAFFIVYAYLYQVGFAVVGVESRALALLPILFASIFLKAVVPSVGISSLALFVNDAVRRGQSGARAVEGSLLVLIADLAAITPFIVGGLIYLSARGVLEAYQIAGAAIYMLQVAGLTGLLLAGRWAPHRLCDVLEWVQKVINNLARILRRPGLPADWGSRQALEYADAAARIARHPRGLSYTMAVAFADDTLNMVSLYAIFLAYGQPLSLGALMATFAMNIIFSVVTGIPLGIGVAEGATTLVLTSLGVTTATALAITLAFRGLNAWLPLFLGFLTARQLDIGQGRRS